MRWLLLVATLHCALGTGLRYDFSTVFHEQSPRALQGTSGGSLPDLVAPTSTCFNYGGSEFECRVHQRIGAPQDYMDLNITVGCRLDPTTGQDFRRATDCRCSTLCTPSDPERLPKTCPCSVCPRGFGTSSVSVDCTMWENYGQNQTNTTEAETNTTDVTPVNPVDNTTDVTPVNPGDNTTDVTIVNPGDNATDVTPGEPVDNATLPENPSDNSTGPDNPFDQFTLAPTSGPTSPPPPPPTAVTAPQDAVVPMQTDLVTVENATNATVYPDPYLFQTCTSIDCGGNCNGTCSVGCSESGVACPFCEASPTAAPTGMGDDFVPRLDGKTSAAMVQLVRSALMVALWSLW